MMWWYIKGIAFVIFSAVKNLIKTFPAKTAVTVICMILAGRSLVRSCKKGEKV